MRKYLFLGFLFLTFSCAQGHKVVSEERFYEADLGMSEKELKGKLGKPYAVKKMKNGEKEFKYIERVYSNNRHIETRIYFFVLKDGRVISKRIEKDDKYKPLLERNAYDLQTSFEEMDFLE